MATGKLTPYETELGKAVADRLGLDHGSTLEEWSAKRVGARVLVTMKTMKFIPADEYGDLQTVAARRAERDVW